MASIAELKRNIRIGKEFKKNPAQFLAKVMEENSPSKTSSVFMEAMEKGMAIAIEKVVTAVVSQTVQDLMQNDDFLDVVATLAYNKVPAVHDGFTPIKGVDYFDGKPGSPGENGKTPKKGVDYFTKEEVAQIIAKVTPRKGKDYFTKKEISDIISHIKTVSKPIAGIDYFPEKGKDGTEIEGKDIVSKINSLPIEPDKQIDYKHIKNGPKESKDSREGTSLHRGGLKLVWNTKLSGAVNGVNTVFIVPASQPDPKDDKFIVSVRGVLKTADAGDFTASNGNRTITFVVPPPNGSDSPRIILYHGK